MIMECGPGGHTCGHMLCILEDIFGLPQSEESKKFDQGLIPETDVEETLPEGAEDYLPASQNPSSSSSRLSSNSRVLNILFQTTC